jgi:hypothetical protein
MIFLQLSEADLQSMISKATKQAIDEALSIAKSLEPQRDLTRRQIKEEYNISYATIHRAMNDGKLNFYRVGGRVMFKQCDVEKVFLKPIPAKAFIKIKK